jgi:hypothetical protein
MKLQFKQFSLSFLHFPSRNTTKLTLTFSACIREMPDWTPSQETVYPDSVLPWFSTFPPFKWRDSYVDTYHSASSFTMFESDHPHTTLDAIYMMQYH